METLKKERKQSLPLALLFSFLVSVAGACLFGLVYYWGFISTWFALLSGMLAFMVYSIFHKTNWLSFVWVLLWTIVLDEVALILSCGLSIGAELDCSLGVALGSLFELIASDSEVNSAFVKDTALAVFFAVLGVVACFISIKMKNKKEQANMQQGKIAENKVQSEQEESVQSQDQLNEAVQVEDKSDNK